MKERFIVANFEGTSSFFKKNKCCLFMYSVSVIALILGSIAVASCKSDLFFGASDAFKSDFVFKKSSDFLSVFLSVIFSNFVILTFLFVSAFSVFGFIVSSVFLFYRSFGLGLVLGYAYSSFGLKGIGYCLLLIVPSELIILLVLIYFSKEVFLFSLNFLSLLKPSSKCESLFYKCKKVLKKFFVLYSVSFISAVIEAVLIGLFIGLFDF